MLMHQLTDTVSDMSDNECALVSRVAAGDRSALEHLHRSYYRRLASFLSRSIGRKERVEEIINDTFMVVWKGAKSFPEASLVSTWIAGIAYRKALKHLRQQGSHAARSNSERSPEQFVDVVNDAEIGALLKQELQGMSFEQRLTLLLAYQLGHALEEIAAITDVPVGTVNARMLHAREKLRRLLPVGETGVSRVSAVD
jgi:RNA polymerase sigma-70 factor (ECF subfamily)